MSAVAIVTPFLRRYRSSPAWEKGIPVFLRGERDSSDLYRRVLQTASERCVQGWHGVAPLRIQRLPVPPLLEGSDVDPKLFSRLAVAYGLSFDRFDIGDIVPPDQLPDEAPRRRRAKPELVSKDQV